ncbi:MAG: acyl-CoA dehydrogenase family protein [Pirellulaceae bacterium]|nr:acyl-CoA dehydrogenase family protein [Pirellulaceae bacterium]
MENAQREKQIKQAEEILSDRLQNIGFIQGIFFGKYQSEKLLPYPDIYQNSKTNTVLENLQKFCDEKIDPVQIDKEAKISDEIIKGLGDLGILGACLPKAVGGMDFSQTDYCQILEILGGHCGSTALFVNAHHSIGPRAIVLFGTEEQQAKYLPKSVTGEAINAFALTEPEAGSDAGNVQTMAIPTDDGEAYIINGEKRWITNGGIASVLTLMARTPVEGSDETKITAFLVTPDMEGFEVVEERMEKCGVRGTATSRLSFKNMRVPKENILGTKGRGLKIALTVLDFGRTTFGASCTGTAKYCIQKAVEHANSRVQFNEKLAHFEMVKDKIAYMKAGAFAMEACTYQTAALIDSESGDFMLETAILKVFATETLWKIVTDTFQIYGGKAYFTDEPFERLMRDARINMIGEGANDVLRAFYAVVGMRDVGLNLEAVLNGLKKPFSDVKTVKEFLGRKIGSYFSTPKVKVNTPLLTDEAAQLGKAVSAFGANVERLLRKYQINIIDKQHQLGRVADVITEIYVSSCVLSRLDFILRSDRYSDQQKKEYLATGKYYFKTAQRRIYTNLHNLWDNDDQETNTIADYSLNV